MFIATFLMCLILVNLRNLSFPCSFATTSNIFLRLYVSLVYKKVILFTSCCLQLVEVAMQIYVSIFCAFPLTWWFFLILIKVLLNKVQISSQGLRDTGVPARVERVPLAVISAAPNARWVRDSAAIFPSSELTPQHSTKFRLHSYGQRLFSVMYF